MVSSRLTGTSIALLCMALIATIQPATALSYEVCESYGAEWITDSPRLTGKYPFYSLLFFCNGAKLYLLLIQILWECLLLWSCSYLCTD